VGRLNIKLRLIAALWQAPATSELRSPYLHHNYPYPYHLRSRSPSLPPYHLRQPLSLSPSLSLSLLPARPACTGAC